MEKRLIEAFRCGPGRQGRGPTQRPGPEGRILLQGRGPLLGARHHAAQCWSQGLQTGSQIHQRRYWGQTLRDTESLVLTRTRDTRLCDLLCCT